VVVLVVVEAVIQIGSLRAIGTGRLEPGGGLSNRSSYEPTGRSAGSTSDSWPAAAPGVDQPITTSSNSSPAEPSANRRR
jgi:hypothetical protein